MVFADTHKLYIFAVLLIGNDAKMLRSGDNHKIQRRGNL